MFFPLGSSSSKKGRNAVSLTLYAPAVDGNPDPGLMPLTRTWPAAFTATACGKLFIEPPKRSENTNWPLGSSLATNDRSVPLVGAVPRLPPLVTGKSGDVVTPATYALPALATA